eukprot:1313248-Pleurochrysis_carterae.AAC.2
MVTVDAMSSVLGAQRKDRVHEIRHVWLTISHAWLTHDEFLLDSVGEHHALQLGLRLQRRSELRQKLVLRMPAGAKGNASADHSPLFSDAGATRTSALKGTAINSNRGTKGQNLACERFVLWNCRLGRAAGLCNESRAGHTCLQWLVSPPH